MATAAPHVKLLRQLASAKDDYLSGAFDISWDGAKATLYLVFGRPSHAVFDTDQAQIEGEAAIDALLAELPRTFVVSDWRRAMSPHETLSISIDELAGPFVRLAGSYADDPISDEDPEWWSSDDSSPDLAFGLADFPLLPGGRPLWAETSPENVNLAERLAELPPSILILTGAKLRAAAVVSGGDIIDAVWIDDEDQARGEAAGMAILGATKGTLAGYALDDPRVAEALTMLWRLPVAVGGIEMAWLDPASMLAAFRSDGLDRVLVIDAPLRGIALFSRGGLVAVYSETQRSAVASPERLRSLLSQARGRLTVMERKPRPVAAGAAQPVPSAVDFFSVVSPEADAETAGAAEPVAPDEAPTEAAPDESAPESSSAEEAATPAYPFMRDIPLTPVAAEPVAEEGAPPAEVEATVDGTVDTSAEAEPAVEAGAEPAVEAEAETATIGEAPVAEATAAGEASPPADDSGAVSESPATAADATLADDSDAPPLPPPAAAEDAATGEHAPPPPAPDAAAEPSHQAKRRWWAFGTRRRSSRQAPSEADRAAAEAAALREAAEAASAAGWGIRQPDASAPPPWSRPRDFTPAPGDGDAAAETAPDAAGATDAEAETVDPAPGWSVVEPGLALVRDPAAPSNETTSEVAEPAADLHTGAIESPSTGEPAAAEATAPEPESPAAPAWSAREVIADSVSWYAPPQSRSETPSESTEIEAPVTAAHEDVEQHDVEQHEEVAESDAEVEPVAAGHTETDTARDFWAEFARHDPEAAADDAEHEPEHATASEPGSPAAEDSEAAPDAMAEVDAERDSEPVSADGSEHETESLPAEQIEPARRKPSERPFAPWNWPLAEAETPVSSAPAGGRYASTTDAAAEHVTGAAETENDTDADQGFFQRDEPVGSQYVDFDEVRRELVQIGVVWLGERNAVPVTALLTKTRSTIDDFVATIDTIRGLHVEGQDPASIQAMAREMHQQAAERLCGA